MSATLERSRRGRLLPLLALVAALALPSAVSADPLALRHAGERRELVVEGGPHEVAAAIWLSPELGLAVDVGLRGQAVGAHFGWRRTLVQGPRGWGAAVFVSGGLRALITEPGLALSLTPAVAAGSFGKGIATLGLALPASAQVGGDQARLPILIELNLGARPAPVSFGVRGALGPVLAPGRTVTVAMRWSAWLTIELPDKGQQRL